MPGYEASTRTHTFTCTNTPTHTHSLTHSADVEKRRSENSLKQTERRTSGTTASKPRRAVESNEAYHPPPNPYLAEQEINGDAKVEDVPPSPTVSWLGEEATFVNCFGETVDREKLDRAKIIGVSVDIIVCTSLSLCMQVCVCVCVCQHYKLNMQSLLL